MNELSVFFEPKTIAIIGASDQFRFGYATTNYLLNSKFKTYPVNIKKDEILGHKAYKNIKDIPDDIDLAIILIGNDYVLESVKDCVEKGVNGIVIESAGFAETSIKKYIDIQNEIAKIAKKSQVRIIGPNCIGVTNFYNEFTTADMAFDEAIKGSISIVAQSGVLGNIFIDWATDQGIGLSKAITIGNKVDVDEIDMLEYLSEDPETDVITLYLEGTKRGKALMKILKSSKKPILILKNGRSEIGSNAVKSHTGSLAGNDQIYNAIFKQFPNVFRVNNFYEMFNIAQVFATQPLPKGKNIAIITGSGSLGALACDEIEKQKMNLANLSRNTINQIKNVIPNWVSINATIDLGPSIFQTLIPSLEAVFEDENVHSVLFIFSVPRWPLQTFNISLALFFNHMKKLSKEYNKPLICVCFGSRWTFEFLKEAAISSQSEIKIPIMTSIKYAIKAFKMMYEFNKHLKVKDSS
ncbi:MAG: acetate--CoA ligase family protein [Promethearchaeota archaeon]